ncbi:MAG: membrane protein insertase YidC [Steroidobacteraceae bacterium]
MDNKRIFLWGAVGILLWLNFVTWQRDYPPTATKAAEVTSSSAASTSLPTLPTTSTSAGAMPTPASSTNTETAPTTAVATGSKVHVVTDVLDLDLNTRGGDIERANLLQYSVSKEQADTPVQLLSDAPSSLFVARSGLLASNPDTAPNHLAIYSSAANEYRMEAGQEELAVKLSWMDAQGVAIDKIYTFKRGSYAVSVRYEVHNNSSNEWQGASYVQLFRHDPPVKYSMLDASTIAYRGPAIYNGKYSKLKLTDKNSRDYKSSITGGWMAGLQHYFVVAAVPPKDQSYDYSLAVEGDSNYTFTYRGPLQSVAAGASAQLTETVFIGPKLQDQLAVTGPELDRTTDYGTYLYIIAHPLFLILKFIHGFVSNWGITIIITTLLIKLAFYRLTASSGRSMAKMRTIGPKLKSLQERFKDDREALGRATMELYKKEKINPVAGCLPMLIQIPFFMGFYWVLLESVELRQAPFFGWVTDLSSRDPYFILPLIMGVANFVQFKMNPPPPDPMQAKIMAFMPVMMTVMMAWFPAGLVLYWITNTAISALQQWRINKLVAADAKQALV